MIAFLNTALAVVWKLLLLLLEIGGCVIVVMLFMAIVMAIWEGMRN